MHDFLSPEAHSLVVAVGDVSGKGVPAALYSAFAGELVRSRTFRRRYTPERTTPAGVLAVPLTIILGALIYQDIVRREATPPRP